MINQTGAIIEAIKFEKSDEATIIVYNLDTKTGVECSIPYVGASIGLLPNFTVIGFNDGDWYNININHIVSAEFNEEKKLQLNIGESHSRGLGL